MSLLLRWSILLLAPFLFCSPVAAEERLSGAGPEGLENLVAGLPFAFSVTSAKRDSPSFPSFTATPPPHEVTVTLFTAKELIATGSGGRTSLRLALYSGRYAGEKEAQMAFVSIGCQADPDTGLTYQWDLIVQHGRFVSLLHADCLLSAQNFSTVSEAFLKLVEAEPGRVRLYRCSCGRGCQVEEK